MFKILIRGLWWDCSKTFLLFMENNISWGKEILWGFQKRDCKESVCLSTELVIIILEYLGWCQHILLTTKYCTSNAECTCHYKDFENKTAGKDETLWSFNPPHVTEDNELLFIFSCDYKTASNLHFVFLCFLTGTQSEPF